MFLHFCRTSYTSRSGGRGVSGGPGPSQVPSRLGVKRGTTQEGRTPREKGAQPGAALVPPPPSEHGQSNPPREEWWAWGHPQPPGTSGALVDDLLDLGLLLGCAFPGFFGGWGWCVGGCFGLNPHLRVNFFIGVPLLCGTRDCQRSPPTRSHCQDPPGAPPSPTALPLPRPVPPW